MNKKENKCHGKNPASLMTDYDENCVITTNADMEDTKTRFERECEGKKKCSFAVEWDKFPSQCRDPKTLSAVMVTQCSEGGIEVPGFGVFERQWLINLVITLDIITMVVFVSYILVMKYLLREQQRDYDRKNVTVDDYAL
jgi:hypothetical protein